MCLAVIQRRLSDVWVAMTTLPTIGLSWRAAFLLVLPALSVYWTQDAQAQSQQKIGARPPVPVIAAPAVRKEMVDRVEALGTTRAKESVRVTASVTEVVQDADGNLSNKLVKIIPNVTQTLGIHPAAFKTIGAPGREVPECQKY